MHRNPVPALLLTLAALLLHGCMNTRVTGFTDPDYGNVRYQSIVAFAEDLNLEAATTFEDALCRAFRKQDVACASYHSVFPPTRQYGPEQVYAHMREAGHDALLMLSVTSDESQSVTSYQTFASATATASGAYGNSFTIPITSTSRSNSTRLRLFDATSGRIAWIGDANSQGTGGDNRLLAQSLAREAVYSLLQSPHFGDGASCMSTKECNPSNPYFNTRVPTH